MQFCANLKKLVKNPNFYLLSIGFCIGFGGYSTLGGVVSPLASEFDFTMNQVSVFGVAFVVLGLVGSFLHAIVLDKFK